MEIIAEYYLIQNIALTIMLGLLVIASIKYLCKAYEKYSEFSAYCYIKKTEYEFKNKELEIEKFKNKKLEIESKNYDKSI